MKIRFFIPVERNMLRLLNKKELKPPKDCGYLNVF